MKSSISHFVFFIVFILLLSACKKDKFLFSEVPEISVQSITPSIAKEFTDTVEVVIFYKDGNGDLGFEQPDSFCLEVWDQRLTQPDVYFLPPLAPPGEEIAIQGTFAVTMKNTFRLGTATQEKTTFRIRIKDRAGNWSNTVETPTLTIKE